MAAAIPSDGIILTELEFAKICLKDHLRSKIKSYTFSAAGKIQFIISSALNAKYSEYSVDWKASKSELTRLERSYGKLDKRLADNLRNKNELCHDISSDIFLSKEKYPLLFPASEVRVKKGYVKRYLEDNE